MLRKRGEGRIRKVSRGRGTAEEEVGLLRE